MQKLSRAFTLIEILVAVTIFSFVAIFAVYLYVDTVHNDEKITLERELYEEARFTLEKIVTEFRTGTIDYAEYWNMSQDGYCEADLDGDGEMSDYEDQQYGSYGQCYQFYAASFYEDNANGDPVFFEQINNNTIALEHQGENDDDAIEGAQEELYIINAQGTEKTILRRRGNSGEDCDDITEAYLEDHENAYCRLEILRMDGVDSDIDGKIDSWICKEDFGGEDCIPEESFRPISTPNIDITDLEFFIAPIDDPYKAYSEDIDNYLQPHMTIIFSSRTPARRAINIYGTVPNITIQTSVSARVYEEVTLYNDY